MSRFDFISTPILGLLEVQRKLIEDPRGFLSRFYCADDFRSIGVSRPILQINHTLTKNKGVVRGLHFQHPPHAESKLVSCVHGAVFDVAVDLRRTSPTFLHWYGTVLSSENKLSLLIPEGFAHGFQTLTDECELIYLHTETYHPEFEGALNVADRSLAIEWPLPITEMSERDRHHPMINEDYQGIDL